MVTIVACSVQLEWNSCRVAIGLVANKLMQTLEKQTSMHNSLNRNTTWLGFLMHAIFNMSCC